MVNNVSLSYSFNKPNVIMLATFDLNISICKHLRLHNSNNRFLLIFKQQMKLVHTISRYWTTLFKCQTSNVTLLSQPLKVL